MQLDKTRIAIRERSLLEILDLSLQVVRFHLRPLFFAWLCGVVPFLLLNYWLFSWMAETPASFGVERNAYWARYFWVMGLMVFFQTPLATAPMTLYLGDAMFLQPSRPSAIAGNITRLFWRLLVCLGLVRGVVFAVWMVFSIPRYSDYMTTETMLVILGLYVLVLRAWRPYLGEIILLERNPLTSGRRRSLTIGRRSAALHNPNAGDLIGRFAGVAGIAVLLTISFVYGFWFVSGVFLNDWNWGPLMVHLCVPVGMWIVAGYFCVVRYLSYLDLRIRREGWEVELRMRAEASRLARQAV